MAKEKLILVTDFAELRAGMICVMKPCKGCGGTHRAMLISLYSGTALHPVTLVESEVVGWNVEPASPCLPPNPSGEVWAQGSIARRALYRVDDGLEAPGLKTRERTPKCKPAAVR